MTVTKVGIAATPRRIGLSNWRNRRSLASVMGLVAKDFVGEAASTAGPRDSGRSKNPPCETSSPRIWANRFIRSTTSSPNLSSGEPTPTRLSPLSGAGTKRWNQSTSLASALTWNRRILGLRSGSGRLPPLASRDRIPNSAPDGIAEDIRQCGHEVVAEVRAVDEAASGGVGDAVGHVVGEAGAIFAEVELSDRSAERLADTDTVTDARCGNTGPVELRLPAGGDGDSALFRPRITQDALVMLHQCTAVSAPLTHR